MARPKFEDIGSYAEFQSYYWYRHELQALCKSLGLEYAGSKAELCGVIEAYFNGISVEHKPPRRPVKPTATELTPDTVLADCGFTFGPKFRAFYIELTGDKNFKFTADMVATAKAVKDSGDRSFTLGDLLDVKLGKITYAKFDSSSCQWNKFVKAFCADARNDVFSDKLKAASEFWALLRDSDKPKVYSHEFIEQNRVRVEFD